MVLETTHANGVLYIRGGFRYRQMCATINTLLTFLQPVDERYIAVKCPQT